VCKYRKKLLVVYGEEMKQIFEEIAATSDFSFEALGVDQDHLHCLVKSKPGLSPVAIVRRLKQESTRRLWEGHETELQQQFWKERTDCERWVLLLHDWQCEPGDDPPLHRTTRLKEGNSSPKLKTLGFSCQLFIKKKFNEDFFGVFQESTRNTFFFATSLSLLHKNRISQDTAKIDFKLFLYQETWKA